MSKADNIIQLLRAHNHLSQEEMAKRVGAGVRYIRHVRQEHGFAKKKGGAWTADDIDALRRMWLEEGLSATQIAMRLGSGRTRNAVLGKLHREGLCLSPERAQARESNRVRYQRARSRRSPRTPRPMTPLQKMIAANPVFDRPDDIARVSFLDLEEKHCRFIPGNPREIKTNEPQYCGLPKVDGLSYCEGHSRLCYAPPQVASRSQPAPAKSFDAFEKELA